MFTGSHWTLIGFEVEHDITKGRNGLHIHRVGAGCELQDLGGHFRDAYELVSGEWVLVRPDGYVAPIVTPEETSALQTFFAEVGLTDADGLPH